MAFNEDTRVKIPALAHLSRLGFDFVEPGALELNPQNNVAEAKCIEFMKRINPSRSEIELVNHLKKTLSTLENDDLGREFYNLLISQSGIRFIDFDNPENNLWECVTELECRNGLEVFRPDITIFVNGFPLAFVEVKKPNNKDGILAERRRIDQRMQNNKFRTFVNLTQIMVFSNNMPYQEDIEPLQGAFYGTSSKEKVIFNFFREEQSSMLEVGELNESELFRILRSTNMLGLEKDISFQTNLSDTTPTNSLLSSIFSKKRFLFLLRFGFAYLEREGKLEKHIMRYPQFFASMQVLSHLATGGKKGIIWHTQGSGKTALAFYLNSVLRDYFREESFVPKFYFIVDRLDLLVQARNEFQMRGLKANTIESRADLSEDLTQVRAVKNLTGQDEITLVNIQKFQDETIDSSFLNSSLKRQRVYFVDEAHRSYKMEGQFLRSLINSDPGAIIISLTGTPLIGKNASREVFGPYIHKYFYDASIADGYTLRLIREGIEANYRMQLNSALTDLEVVQGSANRELLFSHPSYVKPMVQYILEDFRTSRKLRGDETIGGMIVCDSSAQAREIYRQLKEDELAKNSGTTMALILHDVGSKSDREEAVGEFKKGKIDLLIVFNMLLTGFDSGRLKKLYMGRVVREHNLLQALTRVNRPYNNFRYGYVVDFADIREEFEETSRAYFDELRSELGDNLSSYSKLFLSQDEIQSAVDSFRDLTFGIDLDNLEVFSSQISQITEKIEIQKLLGSFQELSQVQAASPVDTNIWNSIPNSHKLKQMISELRNRYSFLSLRSTLQDEEASNNLLNFALEDVYFDFTKVDESELTVAHEARTKLRQARESLLTNFDKVDRQYLVIYAELRRFFEVSNLNESGTAPLAEAVAILEKVISLSEKLNSQNEKLRVAYSGDTKYARVHKRVKEITREMFTDLDLSRALIAARTDVERELDANHQIIDNEGYFLRVVKRFVFLSFKENLGFEDLTTLDAVARLICDEYQIRSMDEAA